MLFHFQGFCMKDSCYHREMCFLLFVAITHHRRDQTFPAASPSLKVFAESVKSRLKIETNQVTFTPGNFSAFPLNQKTLLHLILRGHGLKREQNWRVFFYQCLFYSLTGIALALCEFQNMYKYNKILSRLQHEIALTGPLERMLHSLFIVLNIRDIYFSFFCTQQSADKWGQSTLFVVNQASTGITRTSQSRCSIFLKQ